MCIYIRITYNNYTVYLNGTCASNASNTDIFNTNINSNTPRISPETPQVSQQDGDSLAHTKLTQLRTQDSDLLAHTTVSQLCTQSLRRMGWGSLTSVSFLLSSKHRQCSFMISYRWVGVAWGGVGWGNNVFMWVGYGGLITFVFLCTHRHSNLIIFLAVQQTQALLFHDQLPVGWGGVGRGNNVHVPEHPQAQQPHHLSCCPADTGTALS